MNTPRRSRREFLKYAGTAAVTASMGPFVHVNRARAATELVISSWGGAYQDVLRTVHFEPFMKKTGTRIVEIKEGPVVGKLKAQIESGNIEWDVMDFETSDVFRAAEAGFLERIDRSIVDTSDIEPWGVHEFGVASLSGSTVLAYNTKRYPPGKPHPVGWADFWDVKKFPGPRALQDLVKTNLEFALLADGVPTDKLYPIDVERAFKSLDRIKPHVKVLWAKVDQAVQLLGAGEVNMTSVTNGRLAAGKREGLPVELDWTGGALDSVWWCVARGSKNKRLAMEFIAFALRPEGQANLAKLIEYGPTNKKAWALIDPKRVAILPTAPGILEKQYLLGGPLGGPYWLKHEAALTERWQTWKLR